MPIDQNGYNQLGPEQPLTYSPQNPAIPSTSGGGQYDSSKLLDDAATIINKAQAEPTTPTVQDVSPSLIDTSGRYPKQLIGANNEDLYGQGQSWWKQAGNGLLKGLSLAGTTFLQSTVGLVNGAVQAAKDGKMSSFYDNSLNRGLDEINQQLENRYLPNYYTNAEKDGGWASHYLSPNFLFDGVVKNLGMVAGTVASAAVFSGALGAVADASKMFSVGSAAEALTASEVALNTATTGGATTEALGVLRQGFKTSLANLNRATTAQRAVTAGLTALGQSGIYAEQTKNVVQQNLVQEFKDQNGYEPFGQDLEKIKDRAATAGNYAFAVNSAMIMASNYIQLPRVLASSAKLDQAAVETLGGGINRVTFNASKGIYEQAAESAGIVSKIGKYGHMIFSPREAVENTLQDVIGKTTEEYYSKKNNSTGNDVMKAITEAAGGVAGRDGLDMFLIGGLSGGLIEGVLPKLRARLGGPETGYAAEQKAKAVRTNEFLTEEREAANKITGGESVNPLAFIKESAESTKRAVGIQEAREQHLAEGDTFESKNDEADYAINFLTPKVKYGLYPDLKGHLHELLGMAMTEDGFSQLQIEGKASANDTKEAYSRRINNLINLGDHLHDAYRAIGLKYRGVPKIDSETGKPKINVDGSYERQYPEEVLNKLAYAGAKISDFDTRTADVQNSLSALGLNPSEILDYKLSATPDEYLDRVANYVDEHINNNSDMTIDQKENARDLVSDGIKLMASRRAMVGEYFDIVTNPDKYIETEVAEPEAGQETTVVGDTEQPLGTELVTENGMRIRINAKNEDGTFNVTDQNGNTQNVSEQELSKQGLMDTNITQNSNKEFFGANAGNDYSLRMGNQDVIGKLHYDQKADQLSFEYKEGDRNTRIPVSKELFSGENPLIRSVDPLSEVRQQHLDAYVASDGPTVAPEAAAKAVRDVVDDYKKTLEKVQTQLTSKKRQLSDINAKIHSTETTVADRGHVKGLRPVKGKTVLKETIQAANHLIDLQRTVQTEIGNLEAQKNRLLFHQEYLQAQLSSGEAYPLFKERLQKLNDINNDLIISNGIKSGVLSKLQKNISAAIERAQAKVRHITSLFAKAYGSDKPYSKLLIDELRSNPEFMRGNQGFEKDVQNLNDRISQIEDVDIKLSKQISDNLRKSLEDVQSELAGAEELYTPLNDLSKKLDEYQEQVAEEERPIKETQEETSATEPVLPEVQEEQANKKTEEAEQQENPTPVQIEEALADPKATPKKKETAKKHLKDLFGSTTQNTTSSKTNENQRAHNRFLQRIRRGKITGDLAYIDIHQGNEAALGLEGLVQKQLTESGFTPKNNDDKPIMRVYIKREGGKKYFVDENGQTLNELGTPTPLDQIVYATRVSPSLEFGGEGFEGETRYSHGTPEEAIALQEAYRAERQQIFDDNTSYVEGEFNVSKGQPNEDGVTKAITSNLLDKSVLDTKEQVIHIAEKTGFKTMENGARIPITQGQVYFEREGNFNTLDTKQNTLKDANIIFSSMMKMADLRVNKGDAELLNKIQTSLAGRMYTGDGRKPTQVSFEGDKIYLGSKSIDFTPDGIKANEKTIKQFVRQSKFNVNNTMLKANEGYSAIESTVKGEPKFTEYPSYQHYLVDGQTPDGKDRAGTSLPISTKLAAGDEAFRGTYSYERGKPSTVKITENTPSNLTRPDEPSDHISECNG